MIQFMKPDMLLLIIPLFLVILIIIKRDFIKLDKDQMENQYFMRRRSMYKLFMFFSTFIVFSLLIIALAKPYAMIQTSDEGNPKISVLIDNSTSMKLYDLSFVEKLKEELEDDIPVEVRYFASGTDSKIGDEILNNLEMDSKILLISDGQVTSGTELEEVMLYATTLNASISAIDLKPKESDVSVSIIGPSKTVNDVDNNYIIKVNSINTGSYNLQVTIDDELVIDTRDHKDAIAFTRKFTAGTHKIVAKIAGNDFFSENNEFYKAVTVVEKPKILYVSNKDNAIEKILGELYNVEKKSSIPAELEQYYSVVIYDMPVQNIGNVDKLTDYIVEGNGMFVIGGLNSFDRGGYKGSVFETLLPVQVGRGDKKQGDSNIVLVVDLSGSTSDRTFEGSSTTPLDVEKALVVDIIETLNAGNRVGVVVFAIPDGLGNMKAVKVSEVMPLMGMKQELIDKIKRLQGPGQSLFDLGLRGGYSLLKGMSGSRNIIFITDGGINIYQPVKDSAEQIISTMAGQGIKTYTVGVGRNVDEEWLKKAAEMGDGIYFPASQNNRLKILFGDPEEKQFGQSFDLFVLNPYHFITRDLEMSAILNGFNQVVPRSMAKLLITTDNGEPAVVTWRYGLGRVTTMNVFAGDNNLGQLLTKENSLLISRIVNWGIGDPERKKEYYIDIPDTRIGMMSKVMVKSTKYPETNEIELIKIKEDMYEGRFTPNKIGFDRLIATDYAINNPKEYENTGMSQEMKDIINNLNGRIFTPDDHEEIIKYIKSISRRTKIERTILWWPFVLAALIVYLFSICVRRIGDNIAEKK